MIRTLKPVGILMGRLPYGADLLASLNQICAEKKITLGRIEAIGAVQEARLQYYDQGKKQYQNLRVKRPLEIVSLVGNVSLKEDHPMVHAHICLADDEGNAFGGHLAPGTIVFACEFTLQLFEGPAFERGHDTQTGLPLWKPED